MFDARAAADATEDEVLLLLAVRRDDESDGLANRFFSGVAEHPLRGRVPRLDDAIEVLADNRVVRRFNDRGKAPLGFVRLPPITYIAREATGVNEFSFP